MNRTVLALSLLAVLVVAGCGDTVQLAPPPKHTPGADAAMPAGHPTLGGAAAAAEAAARDGAASQRSPTSAVPPHGGQMPGVAPPITGGTDPFAEGDAKPQVAPSAGAAPVPTGPIISGTIDIDPSLKLTPGSTVFVLAVVSPETRMPTMVKSYPNASFPLQFTLSATEAMGGPSGLDKPLFLRAMVSPTGDVMKSQWKTTSAKPFAPGTTNATLTLKP